jgi:tetratricopeptide (TPR) repeat protein
MENEKSVMDRDAQAQELASQQKWMAAARVLTHAARALPQEPSRWLQIAEWQVRGGDVPAAVRTLERAIKLNDNAAPSARIKLLLALAETHMGAQHWEEGANVCRQILDIDARYHSALELLATAFLQTNQIDAAIEVIEQLLMLSPRDPLHRLKLATLLQLQGRLGESSREFQRVLETHGEFPFAQDAEEAIEVLDRLQTQQILMMASEQNAFRLRLERQFDDTLLEGGFYLSEMGRESLRHMVADIAPLEPTSAPRMH